MDKEYAVIGKETDTKVKKEKTVKYDGHSFSKSSIQAYGTEAKFLEASKEKGHLVGWFENDANRDDKLKEVWRLASAGMEQTKATPVKAPSKEG